MAITGRSSPTRLSGGNGLNNNTVAALQLFGAKDGDAAGSVESLWAGDFPILSDAAFDNGIAPAFFSLGSGGSAILSPDNHDLSIGLTGARSC